ncbi:phosphopantetheine-binding protein, partial [Streptomyces microflavus]|uniref:acyl carrier protein n=1 Tax=Streptomyces microflavus TaxID=1919 RepID=UPI0033F7C92D
MTGREFREVDHDLLADYLGGALDGTPEQTVVARLVAEDPAWSDAHDVLAPALTRVHDELTGWGAAVPEMPLAVVERRGLVRLPARRAAGGPATPATGSGLHRQLVTLDADDQHRVLLDLVRANVAAVLGHDSGTAVEPARAFRELGFDSLAAVELRNKLNTATGLRLPATLVFDYPNPTALADYLHTRILGAATPQAPTVATPVADDEPVAIVAMSCRFPGG